MDKYKRLAKDSIIYLIGSFGSKLVSFLMVSFYTFKISSEDYGKIDITLATISLLMPIISLYMHSATLRFSIENPDESDGVITNALTSMFVATIVFAPMCFVLYYFKLLYGGMAILLALILFEGLSLCLGQYCRAVGNQVAYATSGIISTFVLAGSNILILNFFENKVAGYFFSIILSYVVASVFLFISAKVWKRFSFKKIDFTLYKEMLKYSLPLVPTGLSWWIMSVSDKYTLLFFCGAAANGLYGVAGKIPLIITTFTSTFMGAWNNSAILEDKSEDKNEFQSRIFGLLSAFYVLAISAILVVVKLLTRYLLGIEYADSWLYVPFLLLASMFNGFAHFLETEYVVKKKTVNSLKTTLLGAFVNVVLNVPLIYLIGINGAAVATMLSYFMTWLVRIKDTKETLHITYNTKAITISIILLSVQIALVYFIDGVLQMASGIGIFVLLVAINYREVRPLLKKTKEFVLKKR